MRYVSWGRVRAGRLLLVLLAILSYFLLLGVDALRFFPQQPSNTSSLLLPWAQFGFSAFVALLFLAVGALVWLYARNRRVALLLFGFCFTMMVTFAVETGAVSNDLLLSLIGGISSGLALLLFATLLLFFPKNYFSSLQSSEASGNQHQSHRHHYYILFLRGYLTVLVLLNVTAVLLTIFDYLQLPQLVDLVRTTANIYYVLALVGILITIINSYRQSSSLRERQQQRIFVGGVILAVTPLLVLTVLPLALSVTGVDSQLSTITFVILPLALGYSILRYQILVFDRYVRRAVAWTAGAVGLIVLAYLVFAFGSVFFSGIPLVYIVSVLVAMAVLGPVVWWLARVMTERLFFSEIAYYRRLVGKPDLLARQTFDVNGVARLMTAAAVDAFETQEVCLLVLDDDTGHYQPYPALKDDDTEDTPRYHFLQEVLRAVSPVDDSGITVGEQAAIVKRTGWVEVSEHLLTRITSAERPLVLSEASKAVEEMPTGIGRYLMSGEPVGGFDPLLAAVRAQGKMIGLLALGERGDHQQYAGPDFEAIELIQSRFSPVLETARLYAQTIRHVAVLDALYSGVAMVKKAFQDIKEAAIAYTQIAAKAVDAVAQMWLLDLTDKVLQHVIDAGSGPQLLPTGVSIELKQDDWSPCYYQGSKLEKGPPTKMPSCLGQTPSLPFAWLPLYGGQRHIGILALTYDRPHLFSDEEKRVLGMFADQFGAVLANTGNTVKLLAAYERQNELDRLKDQFITTASHELRTPLTAVAGYIELIETYGEVLPVERRVEFIGKAHRSCDELVLMVGNIMDASRVEIDAENISISVVVLAESVLHVVEILDGVTRRDERTINVDIPLDVRVMADDMRLRQVLLNLVNNAMKYSPMKTNVDITCEMDDEYVIVRVRDYGLGVPLKDQGRLFERFMRLERDMNSGVRGAGLGLYISKRLIGAMKGRIWVESAGVPDEGSVFAFALKRAEVAQEKANQSIGQQEV